ncbi:Hypothetical predicted protein [Prunus dulcis]|uniref:Uncharacterized protein n=1 Tax=Prunus dulcis TaxID=3755 RepID=A0A5E4GAM4_PRUDU|nr:Hypothetical predicted protein [Prunus dulcis]
MACATALSISHQKTDGAPKRETSDRRHPCADIFSTESTENSNIKNRGEFRNLVVVGFVVKGSDEAAGKVPCIHKPIHDKITTTRVLHTLGAITRTRPTPPQLSKLL